MEVTIPTKVITNGRNYSREKEIVAAYILISGNQELGRAVCYMGKSRVASVVYASVWVRVKALGDMISGRGHAGGYGYHKASAAIGSAIESAGITLSGDIRGSGESAIREAMLAIGLALGFTDCNIIEV